MHLKAHLKVHFYLKYSQHFQNQELSEEIPKLLTTDNTNALKNLVVYSFKDGAFVPVPPQDNTVTLFEYEGTSIHKDTPEAKEQQATAGFEGKSIFPLILFPFFYKTLPANFSYVCFGCGVFGF